MGKIKPFRRFMRFLLAKTFSGWLGKFCTINTVVFALFLLTAHFVPSGERLMATLAWQISLWVLLVVVLSAFLSAPYRIWKEQEQKIAELSKVDREDVGYFLKGHYLNGTFIFDNYERMPCEKYNGPLEIQPFKNVFRSVPIIAPKHSLATITLDFRNNYFDTAGKVRFEFIDQNGQPQEIKVDGQEVFIGQNHSFSMKLCCDDNYQIDEDSWLTISTFSWRK